MQQFKLGDKVEWATPGVTLEQAKTNPHMKRFYHCGIVSKIIVANEPYTNDRYGARTRNHESYEVTVGKSKKFWPLVNKLRKVE